jgi:hypothetical protein
MEEKPLQPRDETEQALLENFRKGAILKHLGHLLENEEIELAGFDQYKEALRKLEAKSPAGRDVLLPLLSDPDSGVRSVACAHLIKQHTDLVMPILDEIISEWSTPAAGSARNTKAAFQFHLHDCE